MDIQIDQEALLDMAAEKLADQYYDESDLSDRINRFVRERIDETIKKTIDERVEEALNAALQETLDQTIQPVDVFGDKTGEPTTLRATLSDRAKTFWDAKVDRNGKPVGRNGWSARDAKTRAEYMLGRIVTEEFANGVKENAAQIASALKEAMRADAHKMIDKHLDALVKVKG